MSKQLPLLQLELEQKDAGAEIPEDYVSIALDASQIVGGYWWDNSEKVVGGVGNRKVDPLDLSNEELIQYTKMLQPRYLRIGGTEADRLYYSVKSQNPGKKLPEGYHYYLNQARLKDLKRFCKKTGVRLMMTLNAGPGPRLDKNRWRKKNARQLIHYSDSRNLSVGIWELGNEVNAYPFFMGMGHRLNPAEYAKDMQRLKKLTRKGQTSSFTAGPALAVWPVLGETLPFLRRFLKKAERNVDIITWHYYPQQSSRSIVAVRRAGKTTLLKPRNLDEAERQARKLMRLRDRYHIKAPLWLGETGHALCGGEEGLSDSFYSGFWWLDQLALMARCGQQQIIRQTLTGGDYGLLDKKDHQPLPDYWTTLLWNRYAGTQVYFLKRKKKSLHRLYLHSLKGRKNGYCLIYISLDQKKSCRIVLPDDLPPVREQGILSAPEIYGRSILLNGKVLSPACLPEGPSCDMVKETRVISLPPLSYGFFLLY